MQHPIAPRRRGIYYLNRECVVFQIVEFVYNVSEMTRH